jgi:hypothetical protein
MSCAADISVAGQDRFVTKWGITPMNDNEFAQTLHKFREEPIAHPLDFRPSIERLMDSHHCQELGRIFHRESKWERRKAVEGLGSSLPESRGVYAFVWRPELFLPFETGTIEHLSWVLYVGKAGVESGEHDTIRSRFLSEYRQFVGGDIACLWDKEVPREREDRLARYLTLRPLEYWFLLLEHPRDIQLLERKLIRMLSPPLNKQLTGPRLRTGVAVPAFEENT